MARRDANELLDTWDVYRRNAKIHRPGTVLPPCPICLRPMHRPGDTKPPPDSVRPSRGHVAPKATGEDERHVVVECATCNSISGTRFDSLYCDQLTNDRVRSRKITAAQLARYLNKRPLPYLLNGVPTHAEATVVGEQVSLTLHLAEDVDPDVRQGMFDLKLRNPPSVGVAISVLHSAYLRLFWHLGYEYVLHPGVQGLRNHLQVAFGPTRPTRQQLMNFRSYFPCILRKERPEGQWSGLYVLTEPADLMSLLVFVPGIETRTYAAMMPGSERAAALRKRAVRSVGAMATAIQIGAEVGREARLVDPAYATWGRDMWAMARDHAGETIGGKIILGN